MCYGQQDMKNWTIESYRAEDRALNDRILQLKSVGIEAYMMHTSFRYTPKCLMSFIHVDAPVCELPPVKLHPTISVGFDTH